MKIKLCGMFRDCDIDYANEAKPDYVGFILGFPKSHRNIDAETARRLRSRLDTGIKAVGVFVNSPETTCAEYANCGIIDVIQLHGNEDADFIRRLRELTGAPIIKAAKIRTPEDIGRVQALGADYVLLDNRRDVRSFPAGRRRDTPAVFPRRGAYPGESAAGGGKRTSVLRGSFQRS